MIPLVQLNGQELMCKKNEVVYTRYMEEKNSPGNIVAWIVVVMLLVLIGILLLGYIVLLGRLREDSGQITSPLEVKNSVQVVYNSSGWNTYSNDAHGVSLKYPDTFEMPTVKVNEQGDEYFTLDRTIHVQFATQPKSECTAGCPDYSLIQERSINTVPVTVYEGYYPAPVDAASKVKTELYEIPLKDGTYLQIHYGIAENDYVEISEIKILIEQIVATVEGNV